MIKQIGEDKLVMRSNSKAVEIAFWLSLFALSALISRPKEFCSFPTAFLVGALIILILDGRVDRCTFDKEKGVVRIERIDVRRKRTAEWILSEIAAVGISSARVVTSTRRPFPRLLYSAYLVRDSGEHLELPGVIDQRYGKVLDAAKQVHRFLGLEEPVITEIEC